MLLLRRVQLVHLPITMGLAHRQQHHCHGQSQESAYLKRMNIMVICNGNVDMRTINQKSTADNVDRGVHLPGAALNEAEAP